MWFLLMYLQISAIQGANVILQGTASPCTGRAEVYHSDGAKKQWGLVCHYGWKKENGEVLCRSIGCGKHNNSDVEYTLYKDLPTRQTYWRDQVECTSKEDSLLKCPVVGTHNADCNSKSAVLAVKCSGSVTLSLNLDGRTDACAGVVEFSTPDGIFGVCSHNLNEITANKICQELGCGDHHYIPKPGMLRKQPSKQNVQLNCVGDEKFSWQCMEWSECEERASVICNKFKKLRLRDGSNICSGLVEEYSFEKKSWGLTKTNDTSPDVICTQLNCGSTGHFTNANGTNRLTCSDIVKLRNFKTKCFGDVSFDVNGTEYGVCYTDQTLSHRMGAVVCKEHGCGEALHVQESSQAISNGFLSNVECQGDERSLWHCPAIHEKVTCIGTKVKCSDSLEVRLKDGHGRCSGRVEVKWWGSWRSISSKDWSATNSEVVCRHLNCGTPTPKTRELFIEGKQQQLEYPWKVNCKSSSAKLHECFDKTTSRATQKGNSIGIICNKAELLFFDGDLPCQGRVKLNSFDDAKSTEEKKKNDSDICDTMQCGSLVSLKKEQNTAYANVKCSGTVSVALRNQRSEKCWGTVEVCKNGQCGGVCKDTWKNEDSTMICENLGCGVPINHQMKQQERNIDVSYYSVYCPEKEQNMKMCKFIPDTHSSCKTAAQVVCRDSIKASLREDLRDKCAGKVSLFYAGEWTPVCQHSTTELQNAICKELKCGKYLEELDNFSLALHDKFKIKGLSGIKCGTNNPVSKCDYSKASFDNECTPMYLKCTGWERLLLYKIEGECTGPVYGLSKEKREPQLVREHGWGEKEGQKLCDYLQCGKYISHSKLDVVTEAKNWWNKTYNCSGKDSIWECESQDQPTKPQQLNIHCESNRAAITLSDNCTGDVLIDEKYVCASQWKENMSHEICNSLGCGYSISNLNNKRAENDCWHFSCTGFEKSVWQCGSKYGSCNNVLSVDCKNSIRFGTTEQCGGKLGIRYKGQWQYVCGELTKTDAEEVCKVLKCNNSQTPLNEATLIKDMKLTIICPDNQKSISQCVQYFQKSECKPAEIKCKGYTPKDSTSSVGLILGLLGGVLGLLSLFLIWMNRKRLLLALRHYRNKIGKDVNPDVNEMNKMDTKDKDFSEEKASFLDNSDYEDVDSHMDKSGEEEEDEDDIRRGSSGTEYDDIEGQANGLSSQIHHDDLNLPLLPRRPENILDQDTYEVEMEKQDDYDDVISVEAAANENAGTPGTQARVDEDEGADSDLDEGLVENADAVLVTTEVEVHPQPE